jgi:lipopolysaccharide export system protein LptA
MRCTTLAIVLVFTLSLAAFSQDKKMKTARVKIMGADSLVYLKELGDNVQSLVGNVRLKHENTWMYCDSANFNTDSNRVEAFRNIHIIQNDSIHLYGDYLEYEGRISLAKVRKNVRLEKKNVILTTEFLDYDKMNDVAYYFDGGKIVNNDNVLISKLGHYYPNTNEAWFKDSVVLENPQYTIFSDTLKYNTQTEVAGILGPTFIVSEENLIYSEDGYYDTFNNTAWLRKNSYVQGEQLLKGDTIFYNRNEGIGEVFNNMELTDTANNITITGNYGYYYEQDKRALATKKAALLQVHQGDTLFLHADTLKLDPVTDTINLEDSRLIRAYHHVKFFRKDLQGRCDSMTYDFRDSTNTFYHDPVIWAQGNQMTAQVIKLYTRNKTLYKAELINGAFIIAPEDSLHYNQIKGKSMVGYIKDNELYRIDVDGNGQTIYHPKDNGLVIGVNRAESSNLTIFLSDRKVQEIIMRVQPKGNLNPPFLLPDDQTKLEGFRWLEPYRPKNKLDIYIQDVLPKNEQTTNIYEGFTIEDIKTKAPKEK